MNQFERYNLNPLEASEIMSIAGIYSRHLDDLHTSEKAIAIIRHFSGRADKRRAITKMLSKGVGQDNIDTIFNHIMLEQEGVKVANDLGGADYITNESIEKMEKKIDHKLNDIKLHTELKDKELGKIKQMKRDNRAYKKDVEALEQRERELIIEINNLKASSIGDIQQQQKIDRLKEIKSNL